MGQLAKSVDMQCYCEIFHVQLHKLKTIARNPSLSDVFQLLPLFLNSDHQRQLKWK